MEAHEAHEAEDEGPSGQCEVHETELTGGQQEEIDPRLV